MARKPANAQKPKKDRKDLRLIFSNMLELPKEVALNLPLISITGNQEMEIENYKGVVEYTEERIRLNTSCGILKIEGKSLFLKQITTENMLITGKITKLEYML